MEIRNNINGDFEKVDSLSDVKVGAFVNLNWKKKNLMLPYSPIENEISFSDRKWEWRYEFDPNGIEIESSPSLIEFKPSGRTVEYICSTDLSK